MTENRFDILINKYLVDELNDNEFTEFEKLVSSNEYHQFKFKEYIKTEALLNEATNMIDSNIAFNEFSKKIKKPKLFRLGTVLKYAAVFTGVILSVFALNSIASSNPRTALVIPIEDIILLEENGKTEKLEFPSEIETTNQDLPKEFDKLMVNDGKFYGISQFKVPFRTVNYTLKIPFGKKLSVVLSDGTKVLLNSGSTLTYPNSFKDTKRRVVTLEGEGYFEVTKNTKKPFVVKTDKLNVRVLGTTFNVSAYKNDNINSVTLVEGKVAVSKIDKFKENHKSKSLLLNPNEKAIIGATTKKLSKKVLVDIEKDISWKDREFVFKNDKFTDIYKKLERNFNIKIVSTNKNFNNKEFTGKFKQQDVFEILDAFRVHTPFTYTVEGNSIILKK